MPLTLKQIATRLESLAKAHRQINTVFVGDLEDFLSVTNADAIYPACVISIMPESNIDVVNHAFRFNFRVQFYDLLNLANKSQSNELELQSDLSSIAGDFIAMLNYNEYLRDWQVPENYTLRISTYQLADVCVGVYFDLPIAAMYVADRCQVPTEGISFEPDKGNPIIENDIVVITNEGNTKINNITYIAINDVDSLLLPELINRDIVMFFLGDKLLTPTTSNPTPNQYRYTPSSGLFEFGTDLQVDQVLQIINRKL